MRGWPLLLFQERNQQELRKALAVIEGNFAGSFCIIKYINGAAEPFGHGQLFGQRETIHYPALADNDHMLT